MWLPGNRSDIFVGEESPNTYRHRAPGNRGTRVVFGQTGARKCNRKYTALVNLSG